MASMNYLYHESTIIDEGADIGEETKVWHFSHVCLGTAKMINASAQLLIFSSNIQIVFTSLSKEKIPYV